MKWQKFFIALLGLLPACGICTYASGKTFVMVATSLTTWSLSPLAAFFIGLILWLFFYVLIPRPGWVYVFGHELTHAIWVWLFGGRVTRFHASSHGGYIRTTKTNFWITLAPYFFPVYTLFCCALWMLIHLWFPLDAYLWVLFGLIGLTWGFHITHTLFIIPTVQPDITTQGWFFSLTLIYLLNLLQINIFLIGILPEISLYSWIIRLQEGGMILAHYGQLILSFLYNWATKLLG